MNAAVACLTDHSEKQLEDDLQPTAKALQTTTLVPAYQACSVWATLIPPAVVHSVGKCVDLEECGISGGAGNDGKAGNSYMTVLRRK